jgi:hypothetical protein
LKCASDKYANNICGFSEYEVKFDRHKEMRDDFGTLAVHENCEIISSADFYTLRLFLRNETRIGEE